ncbi:MAG: T9SS type A sorting domain-containing protein [Bacteroidetes bacterium]|nr:T9SS type A sorting domain-containing protein [Bacteroidota bacterium]
MKEPNMKSTNSKIELNKNMKTKFILTFVMLILVSNFALAKNPKDLKQGSKTSLSNSAGDPKYQVLNINNLTTWHAYDGKSNHTRNGADGTRFPRNAANLIYQDGIVWGGKVFTDAAKLTPAAVQPVRIGGGTYGVGTKAGWINGTGATATRESELTAAVKIYRIRRDYKSMSSIEITRDAAESNETTIDAVTSTMTSAIVTQYATDWTDWPVAKGAPYIERNGTAGYQAPPSGWTVDDLIEKNYDEPGLAGSDPNSPADQVLFTIYNDLDAIQAIGFMGSNPIGIEVQKTIWGYKRSDALGDIYFGKYRLINKGGADTSAGQKGTFTIDSMYVCQWSDPDLGTFADDLLGCDSLLSMGYVYNSNAVDGIYASYGYPPPAAGYDFLQGPAVPSVAGDSAVVNLKYVKGKKNLGMSSFAYFSAGSPYSDPPGGAANYDAGSGRWWKMLRGFAPAGTFTTADAPYASGDFPASKYPLSGDPVARTGFLDGQGTSSSFAPGDRRLLVTTGPFSMAAQDTQEIVIGSVCGMGSDRLSSVAVMKFNDRFAQNTYNGLFAVAAAPAIPSVSISELDGKIIIDWGSNLAGVKKTEEAISNPGAYTFEGYNLYQLPSKSATLAEAKRIQTWDVVNENVVILDEKFDQTSGQILSIPVQFGTNSGVERNFLVNRDWYRDINKLNNGQEYFFAVTAYSVAATPGFLPKSLESSPLVLIAKSKIPFGKVFANSYGDTLAWAKQAEAGASATDGSVVPIVVSPGEANGKDYKVNFYLETAKGADSGSTKWKLTNLTDNKVVLTGQTNQADDPDYKMVEGGVFLKVLGPLPGLKREDMFTNSDANTWGWDWTSGARNLTWAGGANGFGFESFQGALGYTTPATLFYGIPPEVSASDLKKVEIRFANVTIDAATGNFTWDKTSANANGSFGYRYVRGGSGAAAKPEFAPFLTKPWNGSYGFNAFERNVPLAVYDMDATPPRRLTVGFLENNAAGGRVNGVYDPPNYGVADNTASSGPREWLFISNRTYSETLNPLDTLNSLLNPMQYMYFATWARRSDAAWTDVGANAQKIQLIPNRVNSPKHSYTYTVTQPKTNDSINTASWDRVGVYPNPYYGSNTQEISRFARYVKFNNLPNVVTVRIYNLAGQLIKTITKNDAEQFLKWDLLNNDNFPVASGMYIAHLTGTVGAEEKTKILKLGIIQEKEILNNY